MQSEDISEIVLKVNIPLLADKVPSSWSVSLVDNPGFGDAHEHVSQLADASMVTSSAYIYLMQTESIDGTIMTEFFKEMKQRDKCEFDFGETFQQHIIIVTTLTLQLL